MTTSTTPSPAYAAALTQLAAQPRTWLVTGAAGFIGSNLVEALLGAGQQVVGLDSFVTGKQENLDDVRSVAGDDAWARFHFIAGDVADLETCRKAAQGADYVLHQAALGSVPRSIADPLGSHQANVDGFLYLLLAARDAGVRRFVYASSSSVYGDSPTLPKREEETGAPLSPYALTKSINEQYAVLFAAVYGIRSIGLRYFNVFGRRQDPDGPYAAVIPKWVETLLQGGHCVINGDGETSRDFCHVANVVQANILAALAPDDATNRVYNIAVGERTTLNELHGLIRDGLLRACPELTALAACEPVYGPFRQGDVRHSLADIALAERLLGYAPTHTTARGLAETLPWYVAHL